MSKVKTYNPTTQQWEESYIGGNVPVMKINNTLPNQTTGNIDLTIPTKTSDLTNDSGYITGMEILKYGTSTWNDFITAYNAKKVVYCRASSNANPATGSQTRLAFMAYVNNETSPSQVEFQYVRSVSSHSATQQGDQVFVYLLKNTNGGTWSVTTREMSTKIVAGDGLSSSYSNGTLTLSNTDVYSTTETLTNKIWKDGKHIYRTLVEFGTLPDGTQNTTKTVNHQITNIDKITYYYVIASNSVNDQTLTLPYIFPDSAYTQYDIGIENVTKTSITISAGTDRSTWSADVIIEYTKTTT